MHIVDPNKHVKVLQFVKPASVAAGTVNSTPVDASGFGCVLAIGLVGTIPADHTVAIALQDDDESGGSFATDRDSVTGLAAADSDVAQKLSHVRQAAGKYTRVQIVRAGTGSSVIGYIILGLNPGDMPVDDA